MYYNKITIFIFFRLGKEDCEILRLSAPLKHQYAEVHVTGFKTYFTLKKTRFREKIIIVLFPFLAQVS